MPALRVQALRIARSRQEAAEGTRLSKHARHTVADENDVGQDNEDRKEELQVEEDPDRPGYLISNDLPLIAVAQWFSHPDQLRRARTITGLEHSSEDRGPSRIDQL
jgi:hypothetical protein